MQRRNRAAQMTVCALFAALIALCAQLQIPLPGVPVNLALLGVLMCGMLAGVRAGTLSVAVYLLMGLCGMPVFAGLRSGASVLLGPRGGFLVGYMAAAALCGALTARLPARPMHRTLCGVCGALACGAIGVPWFFIASGVQPTARTMLFFAVFIPLDCAKAALAALLSLRLERTLHFLKAGK